MKKVDVSIAPAYPAQNFMKPLLRPEPGTATSIYQQSDMSFASMMAGSQADIETLAPAQSLPAETSLFEQGSMPRDVYFVERGLVKLIRLEREGQKLIVSLSSTGGLLGVSSVISQRLHPVSAITLTPCRVRCLPANIMQSLLRANPELSWRLLQMYSQEYFARVIHLTQLGCLSARQRLEHFLWELALAMDLKTQGTEVRIVLPLKLGEIADLLAVTQEHVSRLMKQMQDEGVVRREKGHIIICNLERLRYSID
ncbi:MAG: Crp/Fnr family transcriptional regulator [Blastocatellia bacterium]